MPRLDLVIVACALLSLGGCTQVLIESNLDADEGQDTQAETGTGTGTETGAGAGDGDGGETGDGDGDGDGDPDRFRVVVLADPHVPGPDYIGDEDSILLARANLLETRDKIAAIDPPPDFAIVVGDLVHEAYASSDSVWYMTNPNAFADIVEILDSFPMPVYPMFGESDYDVPDHPRTLAHQLFGYFFARDPYYSIDHLGWRFVFANSQLGQTYVEGTLGYDLGLGSFGVTQLGWLGEQLGAGMPTVVLTHFPLFQVASDEALDNGPYPDIEAVLAAEGESTAMILSGHAHEWSNLPATYPAPQIVLGATRFDTDNFLLIEFRAHALQFDILDLNKVQWGTPEADTWIYEGEPMPGG